jgi:hypothetical protein
MNTNFFSVGAQSCTLHRDNLITGLMMPGSDEHSFSAPDPRSLQVPSGYVKKVRVIPLLKGKKESKHTSFLFYGPVADLMFDPQQYCWEDGSALMSYSAKAGRNMLKQRDTRGTLAETKWVGVLPVGFCFDWKQVWIKTRDERESMFIWLMWNQGVSVNAWRHRINAEFQGDCCFCLPPAEETILYRFWSCPSTQWVWNWAMSLMNKLRTRRSHPGPWTAFDRDQIIFSYTLPPSFKKFKALWPLLKGACLWMIWTQRNAKIFAKDLWPDELVLTNIWQAMIDYERLAWSRTRTKIERTPAQSRKLLMGFDRSWMARNVFDRRLGDRVLWRQRRPSRCIILHNLATV